MTSQILLKLASIAHLKFTHLTVVWFALMVCELPIARANGSFSGSQATLCNMGIRVQVEREIQSQLNWYTEHGGKAPSADRRTQFYPGTSGQAVLVLHGFISSPREMRALAQRLVARGHSVLVPLITGFGASATAANASRIEDWQHTISKSIATLRQCHQEVIVVGHCLGAAVALDAVVNGGEKNISRMALLAPYVRTFYPGINILNDLFKAHTPTIDLRILSLLLQLDPSRVLPIPMPPPGAPDEDPNIPLQAVESALDLQKRFSLARTSTSKKLTPPIFAVVSDADLVVDGTFALDYLSTHFDSVASLRYDQASDVPHYMHRPSANPQFEEVVTRVIDFVEGRN